MKTKLMAAAISLFAVPAFACPEGMKIAEGSNYCTYTREGLSALTDLAPAGEFAPADVTDPDAE